MDGGRIGRLDLTDVRLVVSSVRCDGIAGALARGRLARSRRKKPVKFRSLRSVITPDAPLGWQAILRAIHAHYTLGVSGRLPWGEEEVNRDLRRIAALGSMESMSASSTEIHIVDGRDLRTILAAVETLRTWSDSWGLGIVVDVSSIHGENVQSLAGLPSVKLGSGTGLGSTNGDAREELILPSGLLPLPGWAAAIRHQLERPGVGVAFTAGAVPIRGLRGDRERLRLSSGPVATCRGQWIGRVDVIGAAVPDRTSVAPDAVVLRTAAAGQTAANDSPGLIRRTGNRILIYGSSLPRPDVNSGSQDVFWLARHASDLGHRVTFSYDQAYADDNAYRWALVREGVAVTFRNDQEGQDSSSRFASDRPDAVVAIGHGSVYAVNDVLARAVGSPTLFLPLDLMFLATKQLDELGIDLGIPATTSELESRYLSAMRRYDLTAVISLEEMAYLRTVGLGPNSIYLPMLRANPDRLGCQSGSGQPRAVFVGGFKHPPNRVALDWLLDEVWLLVRQAVPDARLELYGSHLDVIRRKRSIDVGGVSAMGRYVKESDPYKGDVIALAPLVYGGGVKGKVVTAMGHGVPVVGTPIACQGMARDVAEAVIVGETASEFAAHVVRLLVNANERRKVGANAARAYDAYFSETSGREAVRRVLDALARIR